LVKLKVKPDQGKAARKGVRRGKKSFKRSYICSALVKGEKKGGKEKCRLKASKEKEKEKENKLETENFKSTDSVGRRSVQKKTALPNGKSPDGWGGPTA